MKLNELTVGHIGQHITVHHGKTTITGQLQDIAPIMVTDTRLCDDPETAEQHIAGYEINIGGWASPTLRGHEEVEVKA